MNLILFFLRDCLHFMACIFSIEPVNVLHASKKPFICFLVFIKQKEWTWCLELLSSSSHWSACNWVKLNWWISGSKRRAVLKWNEESSTYFRWRGRPTVFHLSKITKLITTHTNTHTFASFWQRIDLRLTRKTRNNEQNCDLWFQMHQQNYSNLSLLPNCLLSEFCSSRHSSLCLLFCFCLINKRIRILRFIVIVLQFVHISTALTYQHFNISLFVTSHGFLLYEMSFGEKQKRNHSVLKKI